MREVYMKRNSVLLLGLRLVAVLVLAAYVLSPFVAIRELRAAARAGDRDRLEQRAARGLSCRPRQPEVASFSAAHAGNAQ